MQVGQAHIYVFMGCIQLVNLLKETSPTDFPRDILKSA